jgi:hypothetical protein
MSLLDWGVLLLIVWLALNILAYGFLYFRGGRLLQEIITVLVMLALLVALPGVLLADYVELRRERRAKGHGLSPTPRRA